MTNRWGGSCVHSQVAAATSVLTRLLPPGEVRDGQRAVDRREHLEDRVEMRDPEDGRDPVARIDEVEAAAQRLELLESADEDADRRRVEMLEARELEDDRARPLLRELLETLLKRAGRVAEGERALDLQDRVRPALFLGQLHGVVGPAGA